MMFGVVSSVCSLFLQFGRRILVLALKSDRHAAVRVPTTEEVFQFKALFAANYSTLGDVYIVADGLKLLFRAVRIIRCSKHVYNGWKHDHYVSNVFLLAPNECIIAYALNASVAMHDSTVAEWGHVCKKLEANSKMNKGRCIVDSAFCKGQYPFLIKSAQDHLLPAEILENFVRLRQGRQLDKHQSGACVLSKESFCA